MAPKKQVKLFNKMSYSVQIKLEPAELTNQYVDNLTLKLRERYEGKYTEIGYVKRGSIEIKSIMLGRAEMASHSGYCVFDIIIWVETINLLSDTVVIATVSQTNMFAIKSEIKDGDDTIIEILTPKEVSAIKNEIDVTNIKPGDTIEISILSHKTGYGDSKIRSTGRILSLVKEAVDIVTQVYLPTDATIIPEGAQEMIEYDSSIDSEGESDAEEADKSEKEESSDTESEAIDEAEEFTDMEADDDADIGDDDSE
jgi:hypothetical protein